MEQGKAAVIRLNNGDEIRVPMGLEEFSRHVYNTARVATPLMKIKDKEGSVHLINVNEIAHVLGPE